jgi:hypothetical protein
VFTHYALRRPLQATGTATLPFVEPRRTYEWLGPAQYWRDGGFAPVWFLAEPKRTDLELIDPVVRESIRRYRWSVERSWTLSGTRPTGVDWYRLKPPGWFVTEGWSLTPETGGITQVTRTGPDHRPIEAFVRRRPDALYAIVGAHHLGSAPDGAATFDLSLDGRVLDTWVLDPANGPNVLRVLDLPAGIPAGDGEYARLTIAAHGAQPGAASPPVAIRQFDVQPATGLMHAFGDGWYEDEYENTTGRRWRWSSDRADLRIVPAQAVRVTLRAENPVKYFRTVPTLRLRAGGRVIAERRPDRDFEWEVTVPADDVVRSAGVITIETDRVYLPGPAEGTSDTRRLGLRVFDLRVNPVQD